MIGMERLGVDFGALREGSVCRYTDFGYGKGYGGWGGKVGMNELEGEVC